MEARLHPGRKANLLLAYLTSSGGSIQHDSLDLEGLSTGNVAGGTRGVAKVRRAYPTIS